jgi:probable HAF family extracellular repeat protein
MSSRKRCRVLIAATAFLGSTWVSISLAAQYTITGLGTLGGAESYAYGLNASGQVVGEAETANGIEHAFLYSQGTMVDLGTVGGAVSYATAINSSGQVVGMAETSSADTSNNQRAFLYTSGTMVDLTSQISGNSIAKGINDSGEAVGVSYTGSNASGAAFSYSGGQLTNLGGGTAEAINSSGAIAAETSTYTGVIYSNGKTTAIPFGPSAEITAINNLGQVVGDSQRVGPEQACLDDGGAFISLGTLAGYYSTAYAINDNGQIVGYSSYALGGQDFHAFLYSNGQMADLNNLIAPDSGWELYEADAINNSGQIAGFGIINGHYQAFLMTPVPAPEPASLLLIVCAGLLPMRRRPR